MLHALSQLGRWLAALAVMVAIVALLAARAVLAPPGAGSPSPNLVGGMASVAESTPSASPSATPTVEPTATPEPTVEPTPTVVPTVRQTPAPTTGGAGGPLTDQSTPPPRWTPAPYGYRDVLVDGRFGSTLSAAGIRMTVSLLGVDPGWADANCPIPALKPSADAVVVRYRLTTTWSGFYLDWPAISQGPYTSSSGCITGDTLTFTSGATYTVIVWQEPGATALDVGCFKDRKGDPAYVFRFR